MIETTGINSIKPTVSATVFSRHGGHIPEVPLVSGSRRIGNLYTKNKFHQFEIISSIDAENIFVHIAKANQASATLFICANHAADEMLMEYKDIIPSNLISAATVTGVTLPVNLSYENLLSRMIALHGDQFLFCGSFNAWQSNRLQKQVERHYRIKSNLDDWFYHAPYGVTTLHRTILEARENRTLFGLDFNAMYASCFHQVNYAHPGRLKRVAGSNTLKQQCISGEISGAFNCEISQPSAWMRQHHLFAKSYGNLSINIDLPERFSIILHANEIAFWSQHADIQLIEGVYTDEMGEHPLASLADKVYARRLHGDQIDRKLAKQEMVLMHSCIARSNRRPVSPEVAINQYGMHPEFAYQYAAENHGVILIHKIDCDANVYSLQRQVLANARVKLLMQIWRISQAFPEAELCYANVDSMHYSIPNHLADQFIQSLDIGDAMGKLKLEFSGKRGLWLDPGRWWIANEEEIIAHKSGWKQPYPSYKNMALHHEFQKLNVNHWKSKPIRLAVDSWIDVQMALARLVHQNIPHTKNLWHKFSS